MSTDVDQPHHDLAAQVRDWHPEPTLAADDISVAQSQHLAAALDLDEQFAAGDALPLLWHWLYFANWPAASELGADGHAASGHFMPPIQNRRRMFAGARVVVHAPLIIGQRTARTAELVSIAHKRGRSGELLFITVKHTFAQRDHVVVEEERDLVYRSDTGRAAGFQRPFATAPKLCAPWQSSPRPDTPLLFRFSALTANTHRIHYDKPYATDIEGFPGLVVHGPLLAIYMAQLLRAGTSGRSVERFEFKLHKPVFLGDLIGVEGAPTDDRADLAVLSGDGDVHASATAALR